MAKAIPTISLADAAELLNPGHPLPSAALLATANFLGLDSEALMPQVMHSNPYTGLDIVLAEQSPFKDLSQEDLKGLRSLCRHYLDCAISQSKLISEKGALSLLNETLSKSLNVLGAGEELLATYSIQPEFSTVVVEELLATAYLIALSLDEVVLASLKRPMSWRTEPQGDSDSQSDTDTWLSNRVAPAEDDEDDEDTSDTLEIRVKVKSLPVKVKFLLRVDAFLASFEFDKKGNVMAGPGKESIEKLTAKLQKILRGDASDLDLLR